MSSIDVISKGMKTFSEVLQKYGVITGTRYCLSAAYHHTRFDVEGRSIFDEEWDLCVILDACRADELRRKEGLFPWLNDVEHHPSLASCTWDWLPRTLEKTPDEILQNTTYVCSNPFSDEFCADHQFQTLDEVWRYAWDDTKGTVLPRPVTDRAITHARAGEVDRVLVHYMQPHVPFLTEDATPISQNNFDLETTSVLDDWDRVARGELSRSTAISWYRETLTRVLEDVNLLLSNVDADRVVITADHGEAFGEHGIYGHPNVPLPTLTQVPWVETAATDHETYTPSDYETDTGRKSVENRLRDLGYST